MNDEIMKRREKESLKREIIEEVMKNIELRIETTAIEKLNDLLNRLGK